MPEGAEEGPAVVLLLGDSVVLGEGGAGAGQGGPSGQERPDCAEWGGSAQSGLVRAGVKL